MENNNLSDEVKKCIEITSFPEYLDALKLINDKIILIAVKDTAGYWLNENIQEKLYNLGLSENLIGKLLVGYIAVIKNSEIIYEKLSEKNGIEEYNCHLDSHDIEIISKPYVSGNVASIKIDQIEYAVNERGINIVIFDSENGKVVDSVNFDTHIPEMQCIRVKEHYDIGVVGCWWGSNYGSCLNGYAVYKILKSFGLSVWMINRHDPGARRDTQNARFAKKMYPVGEVSPIIPMERMQEINQKCDMFLAGSDQIWKYFLNRLFDMEYMLKFVDDSKKKISFGSSFGHSWDTTPKELLPQAINLLRRFDAISVREESGVDICREVYGIKAQKVIEPVFCLEVEEYDEIAEKSHIEQTKPFILTYILDPTPEKREAIKYYSEISGMKAINVLDLDFQVYEENKKALNLPNTLGLVPPEDLMKLYKECEFVLTDSFHGTSFAIIFNKPFLSINNLKRGAVRFGELLGKFGLLDRLVPNPEVIPEDTRFFEQIDYTEINKVIEKERKESIEWLRNAVQTPREALPSILASDKAITTRLKKELCMGCGACVSACPTDALQLKQDDLGYYRSTINYDKCINCGKCSQVCAALKLPINTNRKEPECYEFITSDEELLHKSSSGGAFPIFAKEIFKRNGCVVGAAWKDDFTVEHIMIDKAEQLSKLQKSKYLQSYLGNTFRKVKEKLDQDIFVLFSGCPCQVTGLKAYLGKEYENLLTVDLLCGNSPSSMFFEKYLKDVFPEGVREYGFRHKVDGWKADCVTVTVTVTDGTQYVRRGPIDEYQRVYHNHTMCAKHCEKCNYQSLPRFGDLTIGDFWGIENKDYSIDANKGVSVILCNNAKGKRFLQEIDRNEIKVMKEVPLEWLGGNGYAREGCHNYSSPKRDAFYESIKTMSFSKAVNYALKPNHGVYNKIYERTNSILQYNENTCYFKFDSNIWDEKNNNGKMILHVKSDKAPIGKYACLSLCKPLNQDKKYSCALRFRVKTESLVVNFHVKDSGSNYHQIIKRYDVLKTGNGNEWIELAFQFEPNADIYDEFMIGASQISGKDNFIEFSYINIEEL